MAGLIEKQMQGGAAGQAGMGAPEPRMGAYAGEDGQQGAPQSEKQQARPQEGQGQQFGEQASQEEQEAYERVVLAGMELLYNEESTQALMQILQAGADQPPQALAQTTMMIMQQLDEAAGGVEPDLILPAASEIMEKVGELANEAGVFEVNQTVLDASAQQMILMAAEEYGVDPAELQQLFAEIPDEQISQMVAEQQQAASMMAGGQLGQPQPRPQPQPTAQPQPQPQQQGGMV